MRKFIATLALIAAFSAAAAVRSTVLVENFDRIQVRGNLNVIYRCVPDSAGMVVYDSNTELLSRLMLENKNDRLRIELQESEDGADSLISLPALTVYSTSLAAAENFGDSTLVIDRPAPCISLKLKLEGNGNIIARDVHATVLEASVPRGEGCITVWGKCRDAKLSLRSKGTIDADRLSATDVRCSLFNSGLVECWVNGGDLVIQGMTGATVRYRGKPVNIKNRSTNCKLVSIDEEEAGLPQN